ncbi:MAG: alpha/beta hydrolase [Eubacterium sp.]|nr:alpha/beta hydrolase [Eubacterium sp.]
MAVKYNIHPDFKLLAAIHPPLNRKSIQRIQKMMGLLYYQQKSDRTVEVQRIRIRTGEDSFVKALLYTPKNRKVQGNLLYCHGGGYAFPAAPYQYKLARLYAERAGCRVLFPDYRLAPGHPFPAAPEDCFAAYRWLLRFAKDNPTAVCGDSAGGTLAMAVCLMAIDNEIRVPCAQLLTYPSVGNCGETESIRLYTDTPMCNSRDMDIYGEWYVQDETAGKLAYRSPVEADSYEGIPMTYIETAQFDCLRDGALIYADRLKECGIPVELYKTKGTVHGYDMMLKSRIVKALIEKRVAFLKKAFLKTDR